MIKYQLTYKQYDTSGNYIVGSERSIITSCYDHPKLGEIVKWHNPERVEKLVGALMLDQSGRHSMLKNHLYQHCSGMIGIIKHFENEVFFVPLSDHDMDIMVVDEQENFVEDFLPYNDQLKIKTPFDWIKEI